MDLQLTPEEIGTIVSFIVPGYLAIRAYMLVHTKVERDFSKVAVESIALSLPITGLYNAFWRHILLKGSPDKTLYTTSIKYAIPLLLIAIVVGYGWGWLRKKKPLNAISRTLMLPSPSDDFMAAQWAKLHGNEYVTVTLKNGKVFRGVRSMISTYRRGEEQMCSFDYIVWYQKSTKQWAAVRTDTLILRVSDIDHIETSRILPG